jgi:hypothetical protein
MHIEDNKQNIYNNIEQLKIVKIRGRKKAEISDYG